LHALSATEGACVGEFAADRFYKPFAAAPEIMSGFVWFKKKSTTRGQTEPYHYENRALFMKKESVSSGGSLETQTTSPAIDEVQANWQGVVRRRSFLQGAAALRIQQRRSMPLLLARGSIHNTYTCKLWGFSGNTSRLTRVKMIETSRKSQWKSKDQTNLRIVVGSCRAFPFDNERTTV
jgi:hypothetical protein